MTKNFLKLTMALGILITGTCSTARASIVFTDLSSSPFTSTDYILFLPTTGEYGTSYIFGANYVAGSSGGIVGAVWSGTEVVASGGDFTPLSAGTVIDPSSSFAYSGNKPGSVADNTPVYTGFELLSTPQTDYGWAEVSFNSVDGSATLYGFAVDTSGASIEAGQTISVPEPSNGFLAVLLTGFLAIAGVYRLRRQAA